MVVVIVVKIIAKKKQCDSCCDVAEESSKGSVRGLKMMKLLVVCVSFAFSLRGLKQPVQEQ